MSRLLTGDPLIAVWTLWCLAVLGGLVAACAILLLARHTLGLRHERRFRRRVCQAGRLLAPALAGATPAAPLLLAARRRFGLAVVVTVLRRARRMLAGEAELRISQLIEQTGEPERLVRAARRGGVLRRARALERLGECGGETARRELLRALASRQALLRRRAREALAELREPFAVRAAVAAFLAEPGTSSSAVRSFFLRLAAWAPGELRRLAADGRLDTRDLKLALEALAETADAAAAPLAIEAVRSPASELRAAAVRLLAAVADPRWARLLTRRLDDRAWFVRAAAARGLGGLALEPHAHEALGRRLADGHWWVRANAAGSLARQGACGIRQLTSAVRSGNRFARQAALPVLLRLGGPRPGAHPFGGRRAAAG